MSLPLSLSPRRKKFHQVPPNCAEEEEDDSRATKNPPLDVVDLERARLQNPGPRMSDDITPRNTSLSSLPPPPPTAQKWIQEREKTLFFCATCCFIKVCLIEEDWGGGSSRIRELHRHDRFLRTYERAQECEVALALLVVCHKKRTNKNRKDEKVRLRPRP